ncbi:MAG: hypothetical protein KBE09_04400 [Candidatus Pacebacteria bacterium]|nr:hypothetical protein [Candidatus Paceibacterota bacterium]
MRRNSIVLALVLNTLITSAVHACAFINEGCVSRHGDLSWIEIPAPAQSYLEERGVRVTGGMGTTPLRIALSDYVFEIRPADARTAHVWLVEGDDPRDKVVVFVLESEQGVRQVCEVSSYETAYWSHQCSSSMAASASQPHKK